MLKMECIMKTQDNMMQENNGMKQSSACYTNLSVEDLKNLWGTPIPKTIL
jgi:hypothetical protein